MTWCDTILMNRSLSKEALGCGESDVFFLNESESLIDHPQCEDDCVSIIDNLKE